MYKRIAVSNEYTVCSILFFSTKKIMTKPYVTFASIADTVSDVKMDGGLTKPEKVGPVIHKLMKTAESIPNLKGAEKKQWVDSAARLVAKHVNAPDAADQWIDVGLSSVDVIIQAAKGEDVEVYGVKKSCVVQILQKVFPCCF